jgi:hypothetical protein
VLTRGKALWASLFGSGNQPATQRVKIDVVTEHPATGVFALILVETGPWKAGTEDAELRRIQARLYDCVDVAVDGHLAATYPKSLGRPVRIQLDTYDIPEGLVRPFFDRFAEHVRTWPEVQQAIQAKHNVTSLAFEYNARVIDGNLSQ